MKATVLSSLHCPYSGSPLVVSKVFEENGDEIEHGIVTSEASVFPILEGILRLQCDEYRVAIVESLSARRFSKALSIALLDAPSCGHRDMLTRLVCRIAYKSGFNTTAERLNRLGRNLASDIKADDSTFVETIEKLCSRGTAEWQIYRYSMPTFLPVFALLPVAKTGGVILDFGCGAGQAAFLLARLQPKSDIICADYSFFSLLLARKYFVPDATYVCLDGNHLLPFESGQFSTLFSNDTLHCIESKLSLVREFSRISSDIGVTLLPHLHNRVASPYAKSLTPQGYKRLFFGFETRIIPEQDIIRDLFLFDTVDLAKEWSDDSLLASKQGVSIVASRDSSVFKKHNGIWHQRMWSFRSPGINPAYQISGQPMKWQVTRRVEKRHVKAIDDEGGYYLPHSCTISARSLDSAGLCELRKAEPDLFAQLSRQLVVLELPDRFMRGNSGMN